MAAALQLPDLLNKGDQLIVEGTGFAITTAYTVIISKRGSGFTAVFKNTTSGGGAVDTTNKLSLIMDSEGVLDVSVSDGTSTVTGQIPIWHVG